MTCEYGVRTRASDYQHTSHIPTHPPSHPLTRPLTPFIRVKVAPTLLCIHPQGNQQMYSSKNLQLRKKLSCNRGILAAIELFWRVLDLTKDSWYGHVVLVECGCGGCILRIYIMLACRYIFSNILIEWLVYPLLFGNFASAGWLPGHTDWQRAFDNCSRAHVFPLRTPRGCIQKLDYIVMNIKIQKVMRRGNILATSRVTALVYACMATIANSQLETP